ncbi:MAG: GGDEF domain-containing protein [Betaproteobacteria bacterium]|nr:GGDEF domain-containing protein [Betaproteobacteria bacterium]
MPTLDLFFVDFRSGWRKAALWSASLGAIILLGAIRSATDAEYAFASLALLPILALAWFLGLVPGLAAAILAATTWIVADFASDRQFSSTWVPWANGATRLLTYGLVGVLAAQMRSHLDREHENANHDPLTGLRNRRGFLEKGQDEVERSKRYSRPMAVIFVDLDNFKKLNDTRGHGTGDRALRATAQALRAGVRSTDHLARLGGDEFAILLAEIDHGEAMGVARMISTALDERLAGFAPVTASLGVAWFATADRPFPEMLKAADELMYEAKGAGDGALRSRRFDGAAGSGRSPASHPRRTQDEATGTLPEPPQSNS